MSLNLRQITADDIALRRLRAERRGEPLESVFSDGI